VATRILHLLPLATWAGLPAGAAYAPASLATEGVVHCSPDEAAALAVADNLDAGAGQLVALVIDADASGHELTWEAAEPPVPGVDPATRFPHLHGPVERAAVAAVLYARRDPSGRCTALEARPELAEALDLLPHPEGGWYRQTWAAPQRLAPPGYDGERVAATAILFLLAPGEASRWHRVRSDELWLWHRGGPLALRLGGRGERPEDHGAAVLGPAVELGHAVQALVPGGTWQAARPAGDREVLVSCVVAPGFDFADFEVE
jgi:predicted cupin superfamily sugar epimerase/uncharacterized protein (DUF952 family)